MKKLITALSILCASFALQVDAPRFPVVGAEVGDNTIADKATDKRATYGGKYAQGPQLAIGRETIAAHIVLALKQVEHHRGGDCHYHCQQRDQWHLVAIYHRQRCYREHDTKGHSKLGAPDKHVLLLVHNIIKIVTFITTKMQSYEIVFTYKVYKFTFFQSKYLVARA